MPLLFPRPRRKPCPYRQNKNTCILSQNPPAQNRMSCKKLTVSRLSASFSGRLGKRSVSQYTPAPTARKIRDIFQYRRNAAKKTRSATQGVMAQIFRVKGDHFGAYPSHTSIDRNHTVTLTVLPIRTPRCVFIRARARLHRHIHPQHASLAANLITPYLENITFSLLNILVSTHDNAPAYIRFITIVMTICTGW